MFLTPRDKNLLLKIQSYGLFTTKQICEIFFEGVAKTTVLRRLRILEEEGYVQKLEGLKDFSVGWGLTKRSADMLGEKSSKIKFSRHSLDHEAKLTSLRLYLEDRRILSSWIPEHEIRSSVARKHGLLRIEERVIPDGVASILRSNVQESIAIELELFSKNSRRYRQILRSYSSKTNLFGVWYVVGNATIGRQILKVKNRDAIHGKAHVFWTTYEDLLENGILAKANFGKQVQTLDYLWTAQGLPKTPAHRPASGVSTPKIEENEMDATLTSSNTGKILAEVS